MNKAPLFIFFVVLFSAGFGAFINAYPVNIWRQFINHRLVVYNYKKVVGKITSTHSSNKTQFEYKVNKRIYKDEKTHGSLDLTKNGYFTTGSEIDVLFNPVNPAENELGLAHMNDRPWIAPTLVLFFAFWFFLANFFDGCIGEEKNRKEVKKFTYLFLLGLFCYIALAYVLVKSFDKNLLWYRYNHKVTFSLEHNDKVIIVKDKQNHIAIPFGYNSDLKELMTKGDLLFFQNKKNPKIIKSNFDLRKTKPIAEYGWLNILARAILIGLFILKVSNSVKVYRLDQKVSQKKTTNAKNSVRKKIKKKRFRKVEK